MQLYILLACLCKHIQSHGHRLTGYARLCVNGVHKYGYVQERVIVCVCVFKRLEANYHYSVILTDFYAEAFWPPAYAHTHGYTIVIITACVHWEWVCVWRNACTAVSLNSEVFMQITFDLNKLLWHQCDFKCILIIIFF